MINWRVILTHPGGSAVRYVNAPSKVEAKRMAVELFTAEIGVNATVSMIWRLRK